MNQQHLLNITMDNWATVGAAKVITQYTSCVQEPASLLQEEAYGRSCGGQAPPYGDSEIRVLVPTDFTLFSQEVTPVTSVHSCRPELGEKPYLYRNQES